MNGQTIEMQIHAKSQEALQSLNKIVNGLGTVEKKTTNIHNSLKKISTKQATNEMNNLNNSINKASNSLSKLKNLFTFVGTKRLTQTGLSWMNEAIDYTEQLNLFNVVFKNIEKNGTTMYSNLGKEATRFQYKMNEAFGTNKTQTLYMQGIFQSMGENVGIGNKYAGIMSESMTKLTYDLASLYNKSEKDTAEAIRAGVYSGQTKPLRSFGIDVTQQSLAPIAEQLGITDRSIKQMSQAEKEILRYIATMNQAKVAMGDLANTIESPSNQMKVFRQQLVEAKVAMSSLFIGGFANILPYANAFLMVVKEVSKAIANMFGIKLTDYNSSIAGVENVYDDLGESVSDATGKVKELKRQTLGFDEIHNINENKDSGSGTNISGGIDQRLLEAIKGYDNGMDKVRMKASEIRDKIMEWLGFTKEIDPLTGEVNFKYNGIKTTLKNMLKSFCGLSTEGKILVGLGLVAGAIKLWNAGKKLVNVFGNSGLSKVLKTALIPFKTLGTNMLSLMQYTRVYTSLTKSMKNGILGGVEAWRQQNIIVKDSYGNTDKLKTAMNGAKVAVQGLVTGAVGLYTVHESMKNLSTEGINLANSLGLVSGSLTTIASGVQIGAIFGGWGAVIGGATGAVASLISALDGYNTTSEKMINNAKNCLETAKNNLQNYYETKKAIEDSMNSELAVHTYNQNLLNELNSLVDANGKVKKGYEDRVNFILNQLNTAYGTEYKIIDGTVDGWKDLNNTIKDVIQTEKAEIMLEAEKENYTNAIKNQAQAWKKYNDSVKEYNETNEKANKILDKKLEMESLNGTQAFKNYKYTSELTGATYKGMYAYQAIQNDLETYNQLLDNNMETLNTNRTTFENYTKDIVFYEDLQTSVLENDTKKQNELIENRLEQITTANGKEKLSLSEQIQYYDEISNQKLKILENNGVKITEEMKKQANSQKEALINNLIEQSKTVDGLSDDVVNSWKDLAQNSSSEFAQAFSKLPSEIQRQLLPKLKLTGSTLSNALNSNVQFDSKNIFSGWNRTISSLYGKVSQISGSIFGIKLPSLANLKIPGFENGGIFSNGTWHSIKQYANGGIPTHGSMFVAGEHGAEIVGHINGKTEVLNQSQIASAIYNAVASAMSQYAGGGVAEINVHADEGIIVEAAINGINQKTRQTGVCPVDIPIY